MPVAAAATLRMCDRCAVKQGGPMAGTLSNSMLCEDGTCVPCQDMQAFSPTHHAGFFKSALPEQNGACLVRKRSKCILRQLTQPFILLL